MATGQSIHIGLNRVDPAHYQDEYGNPWDGTLAACEFDAHDMQALAAAQGFKTQILLTEQASSGNVIWAISRAAQALLPGDILLLTYSGHGGQVPDQNDEEEDALDETWCLYDRQVIDDELYALWAQFQPEVRIFMLSDSCHSGSVAKDPTLMQITAADGTRSRALPQEVQSATYRKHKAFYDGLQAQNPAGDQVEVEASVILISGCQDNQSSADGDRNGLFTEKLLQVWDGGKFKGNMLRFQRRIQALMPWYQSPNYFRAGAPSRAFERQRPFKI
jgi:metacaspase-1